MLPYNRPCIEQKYRLFTTIRWWNGFRKFYGSDTSMWTIAISTNWSTSCRRHISIYILGGRHCCHCWLNIGIMVARSLCQIWIQNILLTSGVADRQTDSRKINWRTCFWTAMTTIVGGYGCLQKENGERWGSWTTEGWTPEQPRPYTLHLARSQASAIFKARTMMVKVKNKITKTALKNLTCWACQKEKETREHELAACSGIHVDETETVRIQEVFSENHKELTETATKVIAVLIELQKYWIV